MKLAYTVCTLSHLAHARALGRSLQQTNPDYRFLIGLVDVIDEQLTPADHAPFEIIEVETLAIPEFDDMARRYNIVELCCALKPQFAHYLLAQYPATTLLLYFDSDILIFDRLTPIEAALTTAAIVLTPHITRPYDRPGQPDETAYLNAGLYNAGFVGFRPSASARAMLGWWQTRLLTQGYMNFGRGMFVDQLWLNYVPLFFRDVHILPHPGCNVAYWNLPERPLSRTAGGRFVLNETEPLVFFHYSGYHPDRPEDLSKYQSRATLSDNVALRQLVDTYRVALVAEGFDRLRAVQNAFVKKSPKWVEFVRGWAIVILSKSLEALGK
jgi:hypothetical protein